MSPQLPRRSPGHAPAGDDAVGTGRHRRSEALTQVRRSGSPAEIRWPDSPAETRRPESLADVSVRSGPRVAMTSLAGESVPAPRSARHTRPTRGGRHAAARPPAGRPPSTGTHRAPGTLPIESWLLMGRTRQGALLASLVAVGILLLAMPAEQRRDGFDTVNAAAQAVAGVETEKAPAPRKPAEKDKEEEAAAPPVKDSAPDKAQPSPSRPANSPAAPPAKATEAADKAKPAAGPGKSLRTTGSEVVALTFDDGPDPVQTPKILELLDQYQVKATFCLVGAQVQRHPDIVRQIAAAGHTLCNHTWDHSLTIGKDKPAEIKADLDRTNAAILRAVPNAKIPFFRAPGGNFTDRLVGVAGGSGMTSLYWEVDPRDWDHPEKETEPQHIQRLITDVREQVRPGSIVLSHDFNQPATVAAYEKLLPWLVENFTLGIPGQAAGEKPDPPAPEPEPSETPVPDEPEVSPPADR